MYLLLITVMLEVVSVVLHRSVPGAVVDSVEVPSQLSTTVTTGVAGVVLGAAVPLPGKLVQPFTVVVTVYVPAADTVMLEVVSVVLHKRPPPAVVESVEVPSQLSTTVTTGVAGVVLGAAVPLPGKLVQPFTVVVTVYVPAVLTVIVVVVSPVLHSRVPGAVVDRVEVPSQLSITVTTGVTGVVLGAAVPLPGKLVQPLTVVITVYVPAVLTVIVVVVSPVLHSRVPGAAVDSVEVPSQLSTTVTTGVAGVVLGAAVPLPGKLVQPFTVVVTVYVPAVLTVIVVVVSPVLHSRVPGAVVDRVEVPSQLSTTVTTGVAGVVLGAAVPLPGKLVQPFTVVVTVYVPAADTVMLEVVSVVLHSNVPVLQSRVSKFRRSCQRP